MDRRSFLAGCRRRTGNARNAVASRRITRRAPSRSSIRFRPAAPSMSSAGRSRPRSSRCSSSRSWSRPRPARPVRSARSSPPTPSPDGYTLLAHLPSISGFAAVDTLFGRTPKFTRADFIPIARLTEGPMVLVVNDQEPLQDAEGVRRRRQGESQQADLLVLRPLRRAASAGRADDQGGRHPAASHLPTAGGGPALTAVLGNNAQALVSSIAAANAQMKAGKLRALACFSPKRAAAAPDVPTLKELGYDVEFSIWVGLFAPKGTPDAAITQGARRNQEGGRDRAVQDRDREHRRRRRPSRPARVQDVLGRRCQARRSGRAVDRQGGGLRAWIDASFVDRHRRLGGRHLVRATRTRRRRSRRAPSRSSMRSRPAARTIW